MKIFIGFFVLLISLQSFACPISIDIVKNQTDFQMEHFTLFSDYLKKNSFTLVTNGDHEYVLKLRLMKRFNHYNPNLKFAFVSVDIFDGDDNLVTYSARSGAESKNEKKAYSKEAFELVMVDLARDFKKCEN